MKKFFLNKYLLILIGFGVWMYFFDDNSIQMHNELNKEIQKLESSIDFYQQEIKKDKKLMEDYENPEELERFARETYQMKKDSEDIYLIEVDSLGK